jgi:hypothetical protein
MGSANQDVQSIATICNFASSGTQSTNADAMLPTSQFYIQMKVDLQALNPIPLHPPRTVLSLAIIDECMPSSMIMS